MRVALLLILLGEICRAEPAVGIWKMNAARSTFSGDVQPKRLTVRIEPHAKGEVFTLDRVEADGRATSSSTTLYLDGKTRDFQDDECSRAPESRGSSGLLLWTGGLSLGAKSGEPTPEHVLQFVIEDLRPRL